MNSPAPGNRTVLPFDPNAPPRPEVASASDHRVGRLVPLPGVVLRQHPEREQLQQFLHALVVPLAATQAMLETAAAVTGDAAGEILLRALTSQNEYLLALAADYADLGCLETDAVRPQPDALSLAPWLAQQARDQAALVRRFGSELHLTPRSFLPSAVMLDGAWACRAIGALLRVAANRARPGRLDLLVTYQESRTAQRPSQLVFEFTTRGGGFPEVEHGYVFQPFAVQDAASRPLLGLSIAQRLAELLGGDLRLQSPGPALCTYRLALAAPPGAGARWRDPMAGPDVDFGPV